MLKQCIGDFLLRRLQEVGIHHIFGVPGDFNLELLQQLEDRSNLEWVGGCNELNAAYAADGYARLRGLAAFVVTNGVGALSAINGVAGAYAEHVPVICICGSIPRKSIVQRNLMHHTLADGEKNNFLRAFAEVTAAQTQITRANATSEIDRVILTAWQLKRPVYLELPSDIAYLEITVPVELLTLTEPKADPERVRTCAQRIAARLNAAKTPALLLDMDTDRFQVTAQIAELAEKLQLPVATMAGSKGVFSEGSELFVGVYMGGGSNPHLKATIEEIDCLITVGYRRVDSTSGFFTDVIPVDSVHLNAFHVDMAEDHFEGITLPSIIRALISLVEPAGARRVQVPSPEATAEEPSKNPLQQHQYWRSFQPYLRPGDVVLAEDGTSSAGASGLTLPEGSSFVTQPIWGSIGYTLGALLGTLKAAPDRRHLLFIGDGSFQLTAQELSTILRHHLKPQIFLINNRGYTIERTILGKSATYNDVANWSYADLPKVFAGREVHSAIVKNESELLAVLHSKPDDFLFVESLMMPDDAPAGLTEGGHAAADIDYGPRGPQFKPGSQISTAKQ